MSDNSQQPAGWYPDGSTVGVHRWFDGMGWTEHTRPDPAFQVTAPVAATGYVSTFGTTVPSRLGQTISHEDSLARDAAFLRHRVGEATRVRRGAIGFFCSGLVVLVVTGAIGLALGGPGEVWVVGVVGGVFFVGRAVRDYQRAIFRGAPRLSVVSLALAGVALVAALGLFVSGPISVAQQTSQAIDRLDG